MASLDDSVAYVAASENEDPSEVSLENGTISLEYLRSVFGDNVTSLKYRAFVKYWSVVVAEKSSGNFNLRNLSVNLKETKFICVFNSSNFIYFKNNFYINTL